MINRAAVHQLRGFIQRRRQSWHPKPAIAALVTSVHIPTGLPGATAHLAETVASVALNAGLGAIATVHVLFEGALHNKGCVLLRSIERLAGRALRCVHVARQPTYYQLLGYCWRVLAGRVVLLANPDVFFDPVDLRNVRPSQLNNRTVFVFSVRRGEADVLGLASAANASEVARCRFGQVDRCREWCPPKVWPTSWDAYLFRPSALPLPPPERTPLSFPMNVINAENFALRALRALGYAHVRNGCEAVRAYDLHCAPKTWRSDEGGPAGPAGWKSLVHYRDLRAPSPALETFGSDRERWAALERRGEQLREEAPPKCLAGSTGTRCGALGIGAWGTSGNSRPAAVAVPLGRGVCSSHGVSESSGRSLGTKK